MRRHTMVCVSDSRACKGKVGYGRDHHTYRVKLLDKYSQITCPFIDLKLSTLPSAVAYNLVTARS